MALPARSSALNDRGVSYIVVGVGGINFYARTPAEAFATLDLDALLEPRVENLRAALEVLTELGYRFEAQRFGWAARRSYCDRRKLVGAPRTSSSCVSSKLADTARKARFDSSPRLKLVPMPLSLSQCHGCSGGRSRDSNAHASNPPNVDNAATRTMRASNRAARFIGTTSRTACPQKYSAKRAAIWGGTG